MQKRDSTPFKPTVWASRVSILLLAFIGQTPTLHSWENIKKIFLNGKFSSVQLHTMLVCSAQHSATQHADVPHRSMHKPELPCMLSTTYLNTRQDLSHNELCGCSRGREERWQHRLPCAMSAQTKLTAHLHSFHPPAWGFVCYSCPHFLLSTPHLCSGLSFSQPAAQSAPARSITLLEEKSSHGEHSCPIPLCRELGLVCISSGGEIILLPLVWIFFTSSQAILSFPIH